MIETIAAIATILILILVGFTRKQRKHTDTMKPKQDMSREETDELITVILPTINRDK